MVILDDMFGNMTLRLQDNSPTPTGFHIVYALIQLYMYGKNSVIAVDTADVRIARYSYHIRSVQ